MAIFEATLPTSTGILGIQGPQHSGDKECRIVAWYTHSVDMTAGAQLSVDQLDALISALQALRCTMRGK